jgi:hypothetical protein
MTGQHLDDEHAGIEGNDDPEHAPVGGRGAIKTGATVGTAIIHGGLKRVLLVEAVSLSYNLQRL